MLEDCADQAIALLLSATPRTHGLAAEIDVPRRPFVLSIANDYPHKDWAGLAAIFGANDDLPPLVLVGCPRKSSRLGQRTPNANWIGRVQLWGPEPDRRRIEALLQSASAYVAHSYLEAFPLTPYEARAAGLPTAATDIPSHREVCASQTCFYAPSDPAAGADAIRRALAMGRLPAVSIPQRTWGTNARELAMLLSRAVARSS